MTNNSLRVCDRALTYRRIEIEKALEETQDRYEWLKKWQNTPANEDFIKTLEREIERAKTELAEIETAIAEVNQERGL